MRSSYEIPPSTEALEIYRHLTGHGDAHTNVRDKVKSALERCRKTAVLKSESKPTLGPRPIADLTAAPSNAQNRDEVAQRDELILQYLPLVTAIAAHLQKSLPVHIELDDLVHAGVMGLFDAATKYQTDKKVAFPAYAQHRIRGAILESLRQMDWASRDLRKRYKQVESVTRELATRLNRDPTEAEIAKEMGLDSRRWQALMVDFRGLGLAAATRSRVEPSEHASLETLRLPAAEIALVDLANTVFGDPQTAEEWLREPNLATDNEPPIGLLGTKDGLLRVKTLLQRIEYGVLA